MPRITSHTATLTRFPFLSFTTPPCAPPCDFLLVLAEFLLDWHPDDAHAAFEHTKVKISSADLNLHKHRDWHGRHIFLKPSKAHLFADTWKMMRFSGCFVTGWDVFAHAGLWRALAEDFATFCNSVFRLLLPLWDSCSLWIKPFNSCKSIPEQNSSPKPNWKRFVSKQLKFAKDKRWNVFSRTWCLFEAARATWLVKSRHSECWMHLLGSTLQTFANWC